MQVQQGIKKMGYWDIVELKKEILQLQQKGRIHSQIGSIPDLFLNLNGISTTFWSGIHTLYGIILTR